MFSDINVKGVFGKLPWQKAVALYSIHRSQTITGRNGRSGRDGSGSNVSGSVKKNLESKNNYAVDTESNDKFSLSRFSRLMQMILELVYDPKLFGLQKRERLSSQIDYSDISRYLHLAEFTTDHVIVLDRVPSESLAMHFSADDLVGMVCWLAVDIDNALDIDDALDSNGVLWPKILRDELSNEVRFLAEEFADRYLSPEDTLLNIEEDQKDKDEDEAQRKRAELLDLLLHIFHEIMRWHPPVDAFTQEVADAVEDYLQEGKKNINGDYDRGLDSDLLSGSEKFDLWEFLCLDNYLDNYLESLPYDDLEVLISDDWKVLIVDRGNLPERFNPDGTMINGQSKQLEAKVLTYYDNRNNGGTWENSGVNQLYFDNDRPDLILYKCCNEIVYYRIIDFKYYDYNEVKEKPKNCKAAKGDAVTFYCNKEKNDIQKSKSYAFGVVRFHNHNKEFNSKPLRICLEFWTAASQCELNDCKTPVPKVEQAYLFGLPIQTMIEKTLSRYKAFTRS